jgi:hypothetical protein
MALPPRDKSLEGLLKDLIFRLSLVERRLVKSAVDEAPPDPYVLPDRLGTEGQAITDWNLAKDTGFYHSNGALNQPVSTGQGLGIVSRYGGGIRQEFWRGWADGNVPDDRRWVRVSTTNGSTWTPWNLTDARDSGWISLASYAASGWTVTYFEVRTIGIQVEIRGVITSTAGFVAGTGVTDFATAIPAAYWPSRNVWSAGYVSGHAQSVLLRPAGTMAVGNRVAYGAGSALQFNMKYLLG